MFQGQDPEERCTYFDFSNVHQDFDLSCHVEVENDKVVLLAGIIMCGDEHLATLHDKIHIPLLYERYSTTNSNLNLRGLPPPETAKEYSWYIKSSTLIECPLLAVEHNFVGTNALQEYQYDIEDATISFTSCTERFSVAEEKDTTIDLLEFPMLLKSVKYSDPIVHHHYHIYTIRNACAQPSSPGELILSDFEYELNFEMKVSVVVASTTECNPPNTIDPQIEYFVSTQETLVRCVRAKPRTLGTNALVVSSAFLKHYHLATLIPKEIALIERTTCDGYFVWTIDEIIQIARTNESISDHSTIIIYEIYKTGIEDAEMTFYSGGPVLISKKPVYYSCSPLQTFNLLCEMMPSGESVFDAEVSMFERFFTVLTGNPYKSQIANDPRGDLMLNNSVL